MNDLDDLAQAARRAGPGLPRRKADQSGLLAVVAVFAGVSILGLVWLVFYVSKQRAPVNKPGEGEAPALNVSAPALVAAYASNRVAGDGQYRGRVLVVDGTIGAVDNGVVMLLGSEGLGSPLAMLWFVRCEFSGGDGGLAQLRAGERVRIRGVCRGVEGTMVVLVRCAPG